ncbi:hypothetical protein SEA_NODIGI_61 [Gordonia phage Nodigi]|nr:hypothetical protein SEA_NODIGI_61 [Gordonia phage Nodigi]
MSIQDAHNDPDRAVGMPPETDLLCTALSIIAQESTQPDLVRTAMIALYETEVGRDHVRKYPLNAAGSRTLGIDMLVPGPETFCTSFEDDRRTDYPGGQC